MEAELKTAPLFHTALTAGAEYISAKDTDTGLRLLNIPKSIYDLGLLFDNEQSVRASLKGRYIDWNADPTYQGNYGNVIFDVNAEVVISRTRGGSMDVFGTVHNISNRSQYLTSLYTNTARWVEAGLRYKF